VLIRTQVCQAAQLPLRDYGRRKPAHAIIARPLHGFVQSPVGAPLSQWNGFCDSGLNVGWTGARVKEAIMSQTGLSEFDGAVQKANVWLKDLMAQMQSHDRHGAYFALRMVLHALRDHLPVESVVALGAQFPMLVRGFYYEGWRPSGKPIKDRRRDSFLFQISERFSDPTIDSEEVVRAVLRVLNKHVSAGEIEGVKHCLPSDLRTLWPIT